MSAVVKQVVAEVKATGTQFEAEMAKIEARAKRSKVEIEGTGGAATAMGRKYEMAGRQIAGSLETMARTGKITGEAGKGFLSAASSIALGFGPGGIAIGALSIFGLAVHSYMSKAQAEAKETAKVFEESIARMLNAGDIEGLKAEGRTILRGTRANEGKDGMEWIEQRLRELGSLEVADREARVRVVGARERADEIRQLTAVLEDLKKKWKEVSAAIVGFREDPFRNVRTDPITITAAGPKAEAAAERAGERAAEAFGEAFNRVMLDVLGSGAERAAATIDAVIQQGLKAGASSEQIAALERVKEQSVNAAAGVDRLKDAWRDYESGVTTGGAGDPVLAGANALLALKAAIDDADSRLLFLSENTAAYNQLQEERNALWERYLRLLGDEREPKPEKLPNVMRETALEIQQAADGALQLAQNLFGAESAAIGTLRAVGQIAGNLGRIAELKSAGKLDALGAAGPVLAILGAVSSLFSNPEAARRQRENTEALRDLSEKLGLIGSGIGGTGTELLTGQSGVGRVLDEFDRRLSQFKLGGLTTDEMRNLSPREIARDLGISFRELEKIAADYEIELDGSLDSWRKLQAALDDATGKLGEFGTDLDSARRQASATAQVFGITDPLELLGLTRGAVGGRSPALDDALAGLDLSTAEGRAAARKNLQDLFLIMQAGGSALTPEQLGGLGDDDLLQAILDLIAGLNDVDESLGSSSVSAEKGDRVIRASETQITADQASRLLGIQTSALAELRLIREAMAASLNPVPVPVLSAGFSQPTAGGITIIQNIEINGAGQTTRQIGRAITDDLVREMDEALGRRILVRKRHVGDALTS